MEVLSCTKSVSETSAMFKILTSRRLLMEHLEILEQFYNRHCAFTKRSRWEYLLEAKLPVGIGFVGCLLPIAATSRFSRSLVLTGCVATASVLVFCGITWIKYKNGRMLGSITDLVVAIEQFDNAMKKSQKLIDEFAAGDKTKIRSLCANFKEKMITNFIKIGSEVNVNIYRYYKILEPYIDDLHSSVLGQLDGAQLKIILTPELHEYATNQRSVKKLYNYFLFMQSAWLATLGMAVGNDNTVLAKTSTELCQLKLSLEQSTEKLMRFMRVLDVAEPKPSRGAPLHEQEPVPREFEMITNHSFDLAIKLVAVAKDVVALDVELQSANSADLTMLEEAVVSFDTIRDSLQMRSDECERLVINLKKCLNKFNAGSDAAGDGAGPDATNAESIGLESVPNKDNRVSGDTVIEAKDEFYLHTGGKENQSDVADAAPARLPVAEQQIKRQLEMRFRPVLQQLRERLQPIQASFREREKSAIKHMGMEPLDSDDSEGKDGSGTASETESLCSDDDEKPRRPLNTQNRYDEGRNLLASKQQFAFFAKPAPKAPLEEFILE